MEATPLLKLFARDIIISAKHVQAAKEQSLPLYEVVSGNTTLDLTRFFKDANELFGKYNTINIFKVFAGRKILWRSKKNGKIVYNFSNCQPGI